MPNQNRYCEKIGLNQAVLLLYTKVACLMGTKQNGSVADERNRKRRPPDADAEPEIQRKAGKIMNYTEAVAYIEDIPKFTKKNKPENTLEMVRRLGHPERKMKVIHVAGTNGKGSVCAFLSSILTRAEKRTGLFTSPHLVEITERFQINGEQVRHEVFADAFTRVKQTVDEMIADGYAHPAYFAWDF